VANLKQSLLKIDNVFADVEEKNILKGLNMEVNKGEVHVIMGPNGAGKSTLVNILMGHPAYTLRSGNIIFENENINEAKVNERAKMGIFMSFQNPEEVSGVTVDNFLRAAVAAQTGVNPKLLAFRKELKSKMKALKMNEDMGKRYLNVGFSGGEKKKNEILQLLTLNPKLALLDETDSGLDVDAVRVVSSGVNAYKNDENAVIIITHNSRILENIEVDYVHVLVDGKIVKTGNSDLAKEIDDMGYENFKQQLIQD
jgi:FeS assembly ATPase SufC